MLSESHCQPYSSSPPVFPRCVWALLLPALLLAGCTRNSIPLRNGEYRSLSETLRAYHEYLKLESRGVETVRLRTSAAELTVSLPHYLYRIAQEFEKRGKENHAAKLYLRLLLHYPLLDNDSQLGIRTDNRLRWLLGDKSWIVPSREELTLRLEEALQAHDLKTLQRLISHDFSFGLDDSDRLAVNYLEGLRFIAYNLNNAKRLDVQEVPQPSADQALLKATGWAGGRTWYFTLHRSERPAGWEWIAASWGEEEPEARP